MRNELQDLTAAEAAAITGGDGVIGTIFEFAGFMVGYYAHKVVDAALTPPPAGDFNWARDK